MRRGAASARVVTALLVVLTATSACSVATDDTARPVESDIAGLLEPESTSSSSVTAGQVDVDLTWVRGELLVRSSRPVEATTSQERLDASMELLLAGPDATERQLGLGSLLPPELAVDGVVDGRRVVLDLTGASIPGQLDLAVGQLALTALDVPGVRAVTFAVDGEPTRVPIPGQDRPSRAVRESDYRAVLE